MLKGHAEEFKKEEKNKERAPLTYPQYLKMEESEEPELPQSWLKDFKDQSLWEYIQKEKLFSFRLKDYDGAQNKVEQFEKDGNKYYGQVQLDEEKDPPAKIRHGKGVNLDSQGVFIIGYYKNDRLDGPALLYVPRDKFYIGIWKRSSLSGKAHYIKRNEFKFFGTWVDNLQEGYGEEIWSDGTCYKGFWRGGKKHGLGEFKWTLKNASYKGYFFQDMMQGQGVYSWEEGKLYKGHWLQGQMSGRGRFEWKDGRVYEGDYFEGKKHGQGVFIWPDLKTYSGGWKEGKQHGEGVFEDPSKRLVIRGVWENGKKISEQEA